MTRTQDGGRDREQRPVPHPGAGDPDGVPDIVLWLPRVMK